jgi:hypothetical protein
VTRLEREGSGRQREELVRGRREELVRGRREELVRGRRELLRAARCRGSI